MRYKRLLFFHIPKSGGSSIEKLFLKNHKLLDFVIKIIFKETPSSLLIVSSMRNRIWRLIIFYVVSIFMSDFKNLWGIHKGIVLQHLTYNEIKQNERLYLKSRTLKDFKKFCIVRNPYDRMISAYHFMGYGKTFREFINWVHTELDNYYRRNIKPFVVILPQWEFVTDTNGNNCMDDILRFENLEEDFKRLKTKYKIKKRNLPHINHRTRYSPDIMAYFDKSMGDKVNKMYYWDFEMFGYNRIEFS